MSDAGPVRPVTEPERGGIMVSAQQQGRGIASGSRVAASTRGEDAAMAAVSVWIVVAVHLDGRAHYLELPDSFFTWWHLALYSGVGAAMTLLVAMGARRRAPGQSWLSAVLSPPRGYGWSLGGAALFLAAGLGDMLWHNVFGVETGLDALLSPTHLVLFTSAVLLFTGPLWAAASKHPDARVWNVAAVIAVGSIAAVAGFALSYVSAFTTDAPLHAVLKFPEGTPEHFATEIPAEAGLASYLVTTLVLVVPLAYLMSTRRLPVGAVTGLIIVLAVLAQTLQNIPRPEVIVAAAVAGALVEALVAASGAVPRLSPAVVVAAGVPLIVWTAQLVTLQIIDGVRWSAELMVGTVVLSALVSVAIVAAAGSTREGRLA